MPFQNNKDYQFDKATIATVNRVGGVYGLAQPIAGKPGWYKVLYVGKAVDLRKRLSDHLNDPPGPGITHFFAEVHGTELGRTQREEVLIKEFDPPYNTLLR